MSHAQSISVWLGAGLSGSQKLSTKITLTFSTPVSKLSIFVKNFRGFWHSSSRKFLNLTVLCFKLIKELDKWSVATFSPDEMIWATAIRQKEAPGYITPNVKNPYHARLILWVMVKIKHLTHRRIVVPMMTSDNFWRRNLESLLNLKPGTDNWFWTLWN